jgi:hypothetical protein
MQALLLLNSVQFKAKPAYGIHINSQYYTTYCMLKKVFEMTSSNSHTCLSPGEQIIKNDV